MRAAAVTFLAAGFFLLGVLLGYGRPSSGSEPAPETIVLVDRTDREPSPEPTSRDDRVEEVEHQVDDSDLEEYDEDYEDENEDERDDDSSGKGSGGSGSNDDGPERDDD